MSRSVTPARVVPPHPTWQTFFNMLGALYLTADAHRSIVHSMLLVDIAAIMQSKGAVAVDGDITERFVLANYFEKCTYRQYMLTLIGKPSGIA